MGICERAGGGGVVGELAFAMECSLVQLATMDPSSCLRYYTYTYVCITYIQEQTIGQFCQRPEGPILFEVTHINIKF